MLKTSAAVLSICLFGRACRRSGRPRANLFRAASCLYCGLGEGTIARLDAGECMRSMTEARARELEGLGHQ